MSPIDNFLQRFLSEFRGWSERIRRAAYAESVVFSRTPAGVEVLVTWKTKSNEEGSYSKIFPIEELLGHTHTLHPHAWLLQKRHCTCAREVISGALNRRGV